MLAILLSALFLDSQPISEVEIQAVLEWDISEPPPFRYEEIDRIVTGELAAHTDLPDGRRFELMLRRGVALFQGTSEQGVRSLQDFQACHRLDPSNVFVDAHRIMAAAEADGERRQAGVLQRLEREAAKLAADHPDIPWTRLTLAWVLGGRGRPDQLRILQILGDCHELDPRFGPAFALEAKFLFDWHDYDGCLSKVGLAKVCPPGPILDFHERFDLGRAMVHLRRRELRAALPLLLQSVYVYPERVGPRIMAWYCLSALGRSASAECMADDIVRRFPDVADGYLAKAVSLSLRGQHESAANLAEQSESRGPPFPFLSRAWCRGRLAENRGDWRAAVAALDECDRSAALPIPTKAEEFVDSRLRLALLRASAPERAARNGVLASRLATGLLEFLDESEVRRTALIVLACARAETGDFDEAVAIVDQAGSGIKLSGEEASKRARLKELFRSGKPYRLGAEDPADRLVEIPAVACYFGPLKKINLEANAPPTLPDK